MTPEEFRTIRIGLGLTQADVAVVLDYKSHIRVSELEIGQREIPTHIARLMRAYEDGHRPSDWPKKPGD